MDRLGRQGERERQRDGEKDMATVGWKMRRIYECVGGGGVCGGVEMHTCTYTHSWPALAWFWSVARGHGGHRSQLSACDGLIQTPPHPSASAPTLPNLHLHPSIPPALYLPPPPPSSSSAAGPCLVGMFERRRIEGGVGRGGAGLHLDCGLY